MSGNSRSYLSPTSQEVVESFVKRSEFWHQMPADRRRQTWQYDNPEDPGYLYTATDIVKFTQANCFAKTAASDDKLLNEFKKKLQTEWAASQTTPYEGYDLARLVSEYAVWIDHLFFFGLLTRSTIVDGELHAGEPLFTLECCDGLVNPEGQELEGVFQPETGLLAVNMLVDMLQDPGEFQPLEHLMCVVAHEMTHIYLNALTRDNSAASFYKDVFQMGNHGVQFHELLGFVFFSLHLLVPTIPYLTKISRKTLDDLCLILDETEIPSDSEAMELINPGRLTN